MPSRRPTPGGKKTPGKQNGFPEGSDSDRASTSSGSNGNGGDDADAPPDPPRHPRQDPQERRDIRRAYTQLRQETQAEREDLVRPGTSGLMNKLTNANNLFEKVQEPREGVLDSNYMVMLSNIGKKKAETLPVDFKKFEPTEFAEKLITVIRGERLEYPNRAKLTKEAWVILGEAAQPFFKRSPAFHLVYGSLERDPVVHKVKERRRPQLEPDNVTNKGPTAPEQLKSFSEAEKHEVTTIEVENMLQELQDKYHQQGEKPLCYLQFIVDADSFGLTVENMFYASFLVRDGLARVFLDGDNLPVIEPVEQAADEEKKTSRHQVVISLTEGNWKDIVKTFNLKQKPRTQPAINKKPRR